MAEIKIEKKKPWWPWILALLIILAIVAYFWYTDGKLVDDDVSITSEEAVGNYVQEGFTATDVGETYTKSDLETAEYTSFIGDKSKLGTDFNYTKDALVQLSNAVRQAAVEHGINKTDERLERVENGAKDVQKNGDSLQLARRIKEVGGDIAQIIRTIQEKEYPEMAETPEHIKRTLGAIVPNQKITEQEERIRAFFDACGDALKEMNPENKEQ
ncbi:hypothetical protein [Pricia sp.]|uniref:hypothetical protein n=1 Tax=Pricia sp. TaxID=2268138 RepID=UPI0035933E82